jgi:hypothetical protein
MGALPVTADSANVQISTRAQLFVGMLALIFMGMVEFA